MLKKTFNEGFDAVNNKLDLGFAGISSEIGAMTAAMTAGFDQMKVTLDYWGNEICDKLDAIHDIVNNPLLTASRELYRRAVANAKKQFFEEALEDIKGAVEKNKTDYISWGLMGRIYLFGVSEFSNAIDVPKALEAFTNACKYISPDTDESEEAKKMASEYYFYAAYANYILAACWGILYLLSAVWTFFLGRAGFGHILIIINNMVPMLMGLFTLWFQKWYPAHLAKGKN